jgi:hypothetical protein
MAGYDLGLDTILTGFDRETCWVHARAGVILGENPSVVLTMQKLLLSGSDVFYGLHDMRSDDFGVSWTEPTSHDTLNRRPFDDGQEIAICDVTPGWHQATGRLIGIGHTVVYEGTHIPYERPRHTSWTVYNESDRSWSRWDKLAMPDDPRFENCGSGCGQWLELDDGTLLVPAYFREPAGSCTAVMVMRCAFDGKKLVYLSHGDEIRYDTERGLGEPSIMWFDGRFLLTIRHNSSAYVSVSDDAVHWSRPKEWTFDDGTPLGSYNTQQHWATHSDSLHLVYTRRAGTNDHVFRHRAPLFMGQVDPEHLCIIRDSEQVVVPERGARLGNFGVTTISPDETWVVVTEWMQPVGCEAHGSDNAVFVSRIRWDQPNELVGYRPPAQR